MGSPVVFGIALVGVIALGGAVDVVMNIAATAALAHEPGRLVRIHGLFNAGAVAGAIAVGALSRRRVVALGVGRCRAAVVCARGLVPTGWISRPVQSASVIGCSNRCARFAARD